MRLVVLTQYPFGSPVLEKETIAAFDSETKDYLHSLKDEYFLGDYQK